MMTIQLYGLRRARSIIAEMRKEMAADPTTRRSQDPYIMGQRQALKTLDRKIERAIETLCAAVKAGGQSE